MGNLCCTAANHKEGHHHPAEELALENKTQTVPYSSATGRLRLQKIKMSSLGKSRARSGDAPFSWRTALDNRDLGSQEAYDKARASLQAAEHAKAFDAEVWSSSSTIEQEAVELVKKIRLYDWDNTYGQPFDANGLTGKRAAGQHFLGNVDLIDKTRLMEVARRLPKGAHLHIHFNACLPGKFLLRQARDIDSMYIRSTLPLTTPENLAASRISFMVMTPHEATHEKASDGSQKYVPLGDVWTPDYICNSWMLYKDFQRLFRVETENGEVLRKTRGAEAWLERKMQIGEEEAHGTHQTGRG